MVIEFILGGTASCCAVVLTNPLEVIKTRVQLQGELKTRGHYTVHYKNFFHAFYVVSKNEGILSLQKGLVPALYFQFFANGVRLGVFQVIDNKGLTRNERGEIILPRAMVAGAVSGCSGAVVGSPFSLVRLPYSLSVFVLQSSRVCGSRLRSLLIGTTRSLFPQIKIQLQSRSGAPIAVGHQHNVAGFRDAFYKIYSRNGFRGLWRGATASMTRVTVGSSVQLPTFSKVKCLMDQYQVRGEISHFRRHHHADRT